MREKGIILRYEEECIGKTCAVSTLLWLCEAFVEMLSPVLVTSSGNLSIGG